jgi:5-(carboxyamino)imidazole ribonucleotide mutase
MKNKVLVVFGSKSDSAVYHSIIKLLKKEAVDFDLHICSAHKTPDKVDSVLKGDYKVIIAGAGLAAHLPGVIASKTIKPVIGVPCNGAFDGLDAFLSIVQMPSGIPVLSVGVENARCAANSAILITKGDFKGIALVYEKQIPALEKCRKILDELAVPYVEGKTRQKELVNIEFVELCKEIISEDEKLIVCCPVADKTNSSDALKFLKQSEKGLFVGINRGDNAAIAAIEILGLDKKINHYRKMLSDKIIEDDREEEKCSHEI